MFCRNCGQEVHARAVACPGCGVPPRLERNFCQSCGATTKPIQTVCTKCGVALGGGSSGSGKDKTVAGILGILLGSLGIHKFYLGYNKEAVVVLLVSLLGGIVTCGLATGAMSVIGLVEGIMYLTKSDEEFEQTYIQEHRGWF